MADLTDDEGVIPDDAIVTRAALIGNRAPGLGCPCPAVGKSMELQEAIERFDSAIEAVDVVAASELLDTQIGYRLDRRVVRNQTSRTRSAPS